MTLNVHGQRMRLILKAYEPHHTTKLEEVKMQRLWRNPVVTHYFHWTSVWGGENDWMLPHDQTPSNIDKQPPNRNTSILHQDQHQHNNGLMENETLHQHVLPFFCTDPSILTSPLKDRSNKNICESQSLKWAEGRRKSLLSQLLNSPSAGSLTVTKS